MKRVMKHFKVTFLFLNKLVNYIETLQLFFYFTFQISMVKVTTTKTFKLRAVRQKRRNENKLWS